MQTSGPRNPSNSGACGNEKRPPPCSSPFSRRRARTGTCPSLSRNVSLHAGDGNHPRLYNADVRSAMRASCFSPTPLVSGLKYRASTGLNVDRQEIVIAGGRRISPAARPSSPAARRRLRRLHIARDRVFFLGLCSGTLVDGVTLFHGRVSTVDEVDAPRRADVAMILCCSTSTCRATSSRRPACIRCMTWLRHSGRRLLDQ